MDLEGIDPFTWRRIIRRCRLGASTKLVASVLADYANPDGTRIRPGNDRLVAVTELSDRTVRKALERLRELGLIDRVFEGSKMGRRGLADEYRLTIPDDLMDRVQMLDPDEKPVDNPAREPVDNPPNTGNSDRSSGPDDTGTPVTGDGTPVTDARNTGTGYRPPNQAPNHKTPTNKPPGSRDHPPEVEGTQRASPPVDKPRDHDPPPKPKGARHARPGRRTRTRRR